MDAPSISTLDTDREELNSVPSPASATAPPMPKRITLRSPNKSTANAPEPDREVYVEEDEVDELIDDEEEPSASAPVKSIAVAPPLPTTLPQPPRHSSVATLSGTPDNFRVGITPGSSPNSIVRTSSPAPRRRGAGKKSLVPIAPPPGPGPPTVASTLISLTSIPPIPPVKRKRARTLHKATLEVERQEPETHDNTGTTSAWRLDVPEMNGPGGSGVGGMQMQMPRLQFQQVHQEEIVSKSVPAKRRRGAAVPKTPLPPVPPTKPRAAPSLLMMEGLNVPPPPIPIRKRVRSAKANLALQQDEGTPELTPPIHDKTPESLLLLPGSDYISLPLPTHTGAYKAPANAQPSDKDLEAAPLRELAFTTNAIGTVPERLEAWQTYTGPLDRSGMKTRRWAAKVRSIRTIGGGEWFGKTWIGDAHSDMPKVVYKPPPPVLSEALEKPVKVVKPRKPRVKKEGGSSATGTPVGSGTPVQSGSLLLPPVKKGRKSKTPTPIPVVDAEMTGYD